MDQPQIQRLTHEALGALREGNPVRALALADQIVAVAPEDPIARTLRTHALLRQGSDDEALEEARRAAALAPGDENARLMLGVAAWRAGRLTLAQESFQRSCELSGGKPFFLEEYAWFMVSERGPRLAREAAEAAVAADGESATAWATLGLALFRLRRGDEAERAMRRALELDPNNLRAQSAMIHVLREKGRVDQAAALAEVMADNPAAEEIVRGVREEKKDREIRRAMFQRPVILESVVRQPRSHRGLAMLVGVVTLVVLIGLMRPERPAMVLGVGVVLLALLWRFLALME